MTASFAHAWRRTSVSFWVTAFLTLTHTPPSPQESCLSNSCYVMPSNTKAPHANHGCCCCCCYCMPSRQVIVVQRMFVFVFVCLFQFSELLSLPLNACALSKGYY